MTQKEQYKHFIDLVHCIQKQIFIFYFHLELEKYKSPAFDDSKYIFNSCSMMRHSLVLLKTVKKKICTLMT